MDDETRGCSIQYVEGSVTWMVDFKASFQAERDGAKSKFVSDPGVLSAHGFLLKTGANGRSKVENVCKSCKQIASVRGGRCCNASAQNNRTTQIVIYNMDFTPIVLDTSSAAERRFKSSIEQLTGLRFNKIRSDDILSPVGNPLELDMFYRSPGLTVAIEYNGYQHYIYPNKFHESLAEFEKGQLHDRIKAARCKEIGIQLIVIRGSDIASELTEFSKTWAALGLGMGSKHY